MDSSYIELRHKLLQLLDELLKYGHGEIRLTVSIEKAEKRTTLLEGGRSRRFIIEPTDIPQ